jgi:hypothetical protein
MTTAIGAQAATFEKSFFFRKPIYTSDIGSIYLPLSTVLSKDVIILGGDVEINEPIKTNGGNVLIVADHLTINAPIDTRIWVEHPPRFEKAPDGYSQLDRLVNIPNLRQLWDRYYFTTEVWDTQNKFWYPRLVRPQDNSLTAVPILPMGATPPSYISLHPWLDSNGTDAPTTGIRWDAVQSGDIKIISTALKLCDSCYRPSLPLQHRFAISPPPQKTHKFSPDYTECLAEENWGISSPINGWLFQVQGLEAGRGGAAPNSNCGPGSGIRSGNISFNCTAITQDRQGGLSGKPGFPGRSGALVAYPIGESAKASINPNLGVFAALDSPKRSLARLGTPSFNQIRHFPTRCGFNNLHDTFPEEYHPQYPEGVHRDDNFVVPTRSYTFEEALPDFYISLLQINSRLDSALKNNLEPSVSLEQAASSPLQLFQLYLLRNINETRARLIDTLLSGNPRRDTPLLWPLLATGIAPPTVQSSSFLDDRTNLLLSDAKQLQLSSHEGTYNVLEYLKTTGGLLQTSSNNSGTKIELSAIRTQLAQIGETLAQTLSEIQGLRLDVLKLVDLQTRVYFENKLDHIAAAMEIARSKEATSNVLDGLSKMAASARTAATLWSSNNIPEALIATYKSLESLTSLNEEVSHTKSDALKQQYSEMLSTYSMLLREMQKEREEITVRTYSTYSRLKDANQSYFSSYNNVSFEFDTLLKFIILQFLQTRNRPAFDQNLENLRDLILNFPSSSSNFILGSFEQKCGADQSVTLEIALRSNNPVYCIALPEQDSDRVLSASIGGLPELLDLPLMVVPKNQRVSSVNLFGLVKGNELSFQ